MVAAEDPDAVTLAHAPGAERNGERVRAGIELGEREDSELVDQPDLVAVADAGDGDRPAELTEPVERAEHRAGPGGRLARRSCRRARRGPRASLDDAAAAELDGVVDNRFESGPWRANLSGTVGIGQMCRLFGMSGGRRAGACRPSGCSRRPTRWRSRAGASPTEPALGCFDQHGQPVVYKQPLAAYEDQRVRAGGAGAVLATFIAHIRYASTGAIARRTRTRSSSATGCSRTTA